MSDNANQAPAKAGIKILEGKQEGTVIECLFNPKEYTIQKQAEWNAPSGAGKNTGPLEFKSGKPATMTVELFFDTYEQDGDNRDVSKFTKKIFDLMKVDSELADKKSKKGRPPKLLFMWGTGQSTRHVLDAVVVQSVSAKYTLFLTDGTPVRATLNVTLTQLEDGGDLGGQNPTSGGEGGERLWTVREGDNLGYIAYHTMGETRAWRRIAEANRLGSVRRLTPGTVLVIPNA